MDTNLDLTQLSGEGDATGHALLAPVVVSGFELPPNGCDNRHGPSVCGRDARSSVLPRVRSS